MWRVSIDKTNSFYYRWSSIVVISCLYNLILIPVMIFDEFYQTYYIQWLVANAITDFVNLLDIIVQAKRGSFLEFKLTFLEFMEDGVRIVGPKAMLTKYLNR